MIVLITMEKLNIAYITSCREVGSDELIGREVIDSDTGISYGYRMGNLEHMARLLRRGDNVFSDRFNLVSVIIDDDDSQYDKAWSEADLWPRHLSVPKRDSEGKIVGKVTLEEMTERIPSQPWKNLRRDKSRESRAEFRARKAEAKSRYEKSILDRMDYNDVDMIISDSYVTVFADDMLQTYENRIVNIHPAITQVGHPDRLPGLTPTRDAFTRATEGYVIISDKRAVDIPEGERFGMHYAGEDVTAVKVRQSKRHGVTVHVVNKDVDNGPVISCREYDLGEIKPLTSEAIRAYNYSVKRDILPQAMLAYSHGARKDCHARIPFNGRLAGGYNA